MAPEKPVSPYSDLPASAFWKSAVSDQPALVPGDLYRPRFPINRKMRILTAGSCFAQHVGRSLRQAGFDVIDAEPAPPGLPPEAAERFGYGLYSARYGNIYTVRQLLQLHEEAYGETRPALPVWERDGRFFDAQRPGIEPDGLPLEGDVLAHREAHLRAVKQAFDEAQVFVFTFGLTEAWVHKEIGTVYPTAPGTIAGSFDPEIFAFKNFGFSEVLGDFLKFRARVLQVRKDVRFLVTVSPVPLTATASGEHVEVATAYSKAVLRAVCGELVARFRNVAYFPSYEIITSQRARGTYYAPNLRAVSEIGVKTAMESFLSAHGVKAGPTGGAAKGEAAKSSADVVCEEVLLEAFRP